MLPAATLLLFVCAAANDEVDLSSLAAFTKQVEGEMNSNRDDWQDRMLDVNRQIYETTTALVNPMSEMREMMNELQSFDAEDIGTDVQIADVEEQRAWVKAGRGIDIVQRLLIFIPKVGPLVQAAFSMVRKMLEAFGVIKTFDSMARENMQTILKNNKLLLENQKALIKGVNQALKNQQIFFKAMRMSFSAVSHNMERLNGAIRNVQKTIIDRMADLYEKTNLLPYVNRMDEVCRNLQVKIEVIQNFGNILLTTATKVQESPDIEYAQISRDQSCRELEMDIQTLAKLITEKDSLGSSMDRVLQIKAFDAGRFLKYKASYFLLQGLQTMPQCLAWAQDSSGVKLTRMLNVVAEALKTLEKAEFDALRKYTFELGKSFKGLTAPESHADFKLQVPPMSDFAKTVGYSANIEFGLKLASAKELGPDERCVIRGVTKNGGTTKGVEWQQGHLEIPGSFQYKCSSYAYAATFPISPKTSPYLFKSLRYDSKFKVTLADRPQVDVRVVGSRSDGGTFLGYRGDCESLFGAMCSNQSVTCQESSSPDLVSKQKELNGCVIQPVELKLKAKYSIGGQEGMQAEAEFDKVLPIKGNASDGLFVFNVEIKNLRIDLKEPEKGEWKPTLNLSLAIPIYRKTNPDPDYSLIDVAVRKINPKEYEKRINDLSSIIGIEVEEDDSDITTVLAISLAVGIVALLAVIVFAVFLVIRHKRQTESKNTSATSQRSRRRPSKSSRRRSSAGTRSTGSAPGYETVQRK